MPATLARPALPRVQLRRVSADELQAAIAHFDRYGYCVFPALLPEAQAAALSERFLALHNDPASRSWIAGSRPYETLFGVMNLEPGMWGCAAAEPALAVARHALGPHVRVAEAASKPTWPDPHLPLSLHVDSVQLFHQVPNVPWIVNSMWMLTPFTAENGATGVIPLSHLSQRKEPYPDIDDGHPLLRAVEGPRGSLFLWHGGLMHTARPNRSQDVRVGLNIAYYPPWFNVYTEAGHQPIWPEVHARMPPELRALCQNRLGHSRAEVYERP